MENAEEGFVVLPAGTEQDRVNLRVMLHFAHNGRDLQAIGTGAGDVDDFQAAAHQTVENVKEQQFRI